MNKKIEAKVGLLIDKRTNKRIELPVISECGKNINLNLNLNFIILSFIIKNKIFLFVISGEL